LELNSRLKKVAHHFALRKIPGFNFAPANLDFKKMFKVVVVHET
jgi:hypothetical protein